MTSSVPSPRRITWQRVLLASVLLGGVLLAYGPVSKWSHQRRSESYRLQCKAAVKAKDWEELERVSNSWLLLDPQFNDAQVFRAEAAVQLDQLDVAVESLGSVSDDYQGALAALSVRAEIQLADLGRPHDAEQTWQRMLKINPKTDVAHQRLIYLYAMTLQRKKLLAAIRQAIEVGSEPPEAYSYLLLANSLNFSDGLKRVTRWRAAYPEDETLQVAQALFAARQTLDNSLATFGQNTVIPGDRSLVLKALEKYPTNIELLAFEIDLAIFDGNEARVTELMGQASAEASDDSRFWGTRGWLLERRGNFPDAAKALEKSVELDPFRWQSRWQLADVYRKLGEAEKAETAARISLTGKELQHTLLERPTARDLTPELIQQIADYLVELKQDTILQALNRRL